jgi:predicted dehydrogenase
MSNTGYDYAPKGKAEPVCRPGDFKFAATALDHGHINGQCNGLIEAGAELRWVFDPDPLKVEAFRKTFPQATVAKSLEQSLEDPEIQLIAAAAVPSERGPLGVQVMRAGKHYFTDKTPFTELGQLAEARRVAAETGKKYMVYYSERLHVECAVFAGDLIERGAIGRVVQVLGLGPHRLSAEARPSWFFEKAKYGGILCDIGSHQIEQFLFYSGASDATVTSARVANYANKDYPELEDFGDASLVADNGATSYFRVDWLTPNGLRTGGMAARSFWVLPAISKCESTSTYTKIVSKFAASKGVKLTVTFEAAPEGGVSKQRVEEVKAALRELGLHSDIKL